MEYLKLGPTASIFFDPTTGVLIRTHEVLALTRIPKSKKLGLARRSGHITNATEKEYQTFLDGLPAEQRSKISSIPLKEKGKKVEKDTYPYNPELLKMTPDELRERIAEEGFLDEDMEKFTGLTDVKAMIKLFDEINKEY